MNSPYLLKSFDYSSHQTIAKILRQYKSQTILDVGCDEGFISKSLSYKPKLIVGIDKRKLDKKAAKLDKFFQIDLETNDFSKLKGLKFEAIVLADVLEHLKNPQAVMKGLSPFLEKDGLFIISVANMGFWLVRLFSLIHIRPKMNRGLFDRTHIYDFNQKELSKFVANQKLKQVQFTATPVPLPLISRGFLKGGALHFLYQTTNFLTLKFPNLLGYQLIVVAQKIR